jgi:uncharacterized protein YndB with AHSA1/START domain
MTTTDQSPTTDRIEKHFEVGAPRSRVWRAISDATEFGSWFGVKLDREFAPDTTVMGRITIPKYDHVTVELRIVAMEAERYFAYRWHPAAIDNSVDYSGEPMTLVEFKLDETTNGTAITIIESGFDKLPASRRAEAFRMNEGGWTGQSKNLAAYVTA